MATSVAMAPSRRVQVMSIITLCFLMALLCFAGSMVVADSSSKTMSSGEPLCLLEINQDCKSENGRISIQLHGTNGFVFHQEWLVEDTLFLGIIETDGNRYREMSWINAPRRDFYINVVFNDDTARVKAINPSEKLYPVYVHKQWFLTVEPLLEIPEHLLWTHIPIAINHRNPFTFNSIIRSAKKEIGPLGEIVFPQSGLYRCLSRVESKSTGKTEYSATPDGIVLFVQPNKANNQADRERMRTILNAIKQRSCTIQEAHDGRK